MIFNLFKKSSGENAASNDAGDVVEYGEFHIVPAPRKEGGQWRIAGIIRKEIDGELKEQEFIRADLITDRGEAETLIVNKAKQIIEEQGDKLFKSDT